MVKRLKDIVSTAGNLKSAVLLVDKQFDNLPERPEITELKKVSKKNTYAGWVIECESGEDLRRPKYGFLVHRGIGEPKELIRITTKGKTDRIIYLRKGDFGNYFLGMGNSHGEPHFLPESYSCVIAKSIDFDL